MHFQRESPTRAQRRVADVVRAAAALFAPLLMATSCSDVFGPGPAAQVFVLSQVGGVALDTTENLLVRCMPLMAAQGAEMYLLGDTLFLHSSGRGEWRSHQRSRPEDRRQNSDSSLVFYYDGGYEFRYFRVGRQVIVVSDEYTSKYVIVEGGALQIDGFCGGMRYAPAQRTAP